MTRTAREVVERWPAGADRPRLRTVDNQLRRLAECGRLTRSGRGDRYSAYRYRVVEEKLEKGGLGSVAHSHYEPTETKAMSAVEDTTKTISTIGGLPT